MFPFPFSLGLSITFLSFSPGLSINLFLFSEQCANPVTKLYEAFRGNLHWLYSLTKYSLLQLSRPVLTLVSVFFSFLRVSFSVDRTYRLDSPPIMQGLLNVGSIRIYILTTGVVSNETNTYVRMYIEEFILDDLHYLMYKMELRYCVEITLVFIQSQQWMRNVRIALRSQLTSESY